MTLTKGALTRLQIIEQARAIFNEEGIDITLDVLTQKMGLSKSRVNNHFRTKESLFLAILTAYETELGSLMAKKQSQKTQNFLQDYIDTRAEIMDLQFKYRCGTQYLNMVTSAENEISKHVRQTVQIHAQSILIRAKKMVDEGWISVDMLIEPNWTTFLFVYINGFTQWSIFYNMYDRLQEYKEVKSKYLRGVIFHSYGPFLTKKGAKALGALDFDK